MQLPPMPAGWASTQRQLPLEPHLRPHTPDTLKGHLPAPWAWPQLLGPLPRALPPQASSSLAACPATTAAAATLPQPAASSGNMWKCVRDPHRRSIPPDARFMEGAPPVYLFSGNFDWMLMISGTQGPYSCAIKGSLEHDMMPLG
eukprot:759946-Pelagomonas_calceolata.AAC.4